MEEGMDFFHDRAMFIGGTIYVTQQNNCSIDIPDVLGMWSLADLCDVAWFATVEAETMTRVSLHQTGVVQVHGLGD